MDQSKEIELNPVSVETPNPDVLLSVQDLRVWFELRRLGFGTVGHVHAVDGVSFDLHNSEAIAVVGESGCGKSSLMKTVLRLYRPTEGKILFEGENIGDLRGADLKEYRSHVGYIQQDPYSAMAPFMSVQRILEEPMIVNGIHDQKKRMERITRALEEVKVFPAKFRSINGNQFIVRAQVKKNHYEPLLITVN